MYDEPKLLIANLDVEQSALKYFKITFKIMVC
jgi:hypothetical protein